MVRRRLFEAIPFAAVLGLLVTAGCSFDSATGDPPRGGDADTGVADATGDVAPDARDAIEPDDAADGTSTDTTDTATGDTADDTRTVDAADTVSDASDAIDATDGGDTGGDTADPDTREDTTMAVCGNGTVEGDEECDDGNTTTGDGCTGNCSNPVCGNGTIEGSEECDDGNNVDDDGCTNNCTLPSCGNGTVEGNEECDDGNNVDDDGCTNNCAIPDCGNGMVEGSEECDDGNTTTGDGCTANCTNPVCGNGTVEGGEECDDGNTTTGDGCTAGCENPTAFRIDDADLVDPHIEAQVSVFGSCQCTDVTSTVNGRMQSEINNYNANFVDVFRPLDLSQSTNRADFYPGADCNDSDNDGTAECSPGTSSSHQTTATNEVGTGNTCFSANSSRINSSYTSPNSPSDPCFSTARKNVTVNLIGCSITLEDAVIAAEYSSNMSPANLQNGVLTGFVSESEAKNCSVSNSLLCNSPKTLYKVLDESNDNCGESADRDTYNGTDGWWFYINFSAAEAEWTQ